MASNATTGLVQPNTTMTMPEANVSEYIKMPEIAMRDHSKFLARQPRYARLFELNQRDYKGWARGLKQCGYATNPQYANKLIQIIELYKLFDYDKAKRYDRFMATHSGTDQPVNAQGILHPIQKFNDNYYLIAREGDTFKALGKEVEISWRKLARYNERDKHTVLHKGDIIYLKKKRKKAPKQYKKRPHIVQPGESMYTISQRYGIRIKYLYKMNKLDPSYQVKVGDQTASEIITRSIKTHSSPKNDYHYHTKK